MSKTEPHYAVTLLHEIHQLFRLDFEASGAVKSTTERISADDEYRASRRCYMRFEPCQRDLQGHKSLLSV